MTILKPEHSTVRQKWKYFKKISFLPSVFFLSGLLSLQKPFKFPGCEQTPRNVVWSQERSFPFHHTEAAAYSQDSFCLDGLADLSFSSINLPIPFWTRYFPTLKTTIGKFHRQFTCSMETFFLLVSSLLPDSCEILLGRNNKQLSPLFQAEDSWAIYLSYTDVISHLSPSLLPSSVFSCQFYNSLSEMGKSGLQTIFKKWIHHGFTQKREIVLCTGPCLFLAIS